MALAKLDAPRRENASKHSTCRDCLSPTPEPSRRKELIVIDRQNANPWIFLPCGLNNRSTRPDGFVSNREKDDRNAKA
jgi:hypothetical protein